MVPKKISPRFAKLGDSLILHCSSLTAHNKMATVNNIIKMKFTEEKSYWNFCLRSFLDEVRLYVLGLCIAEAERVLLSSTSSLRISIVDVKLVLTHFDFHLNGLFITLCPKCDISM